MLEEKCRKPLDSLVGPIALCCLDPNHSGYHKGITFYGRWVEWEGFDIRLGESAFA